MTQRDLVGIELPMWGPVVAGDGYVPWLVVDHRGRPVEPIRRYLSDFIACGNRPGSVRGYAYDLLRWWRWLYVVKVAWSRASVDEDIARDEPLWRNTRKLELGDCGRPYGTPCRHEHACIRCPMLRIDPRLRGRLTDIIHNLTDRVAEAKANGWLGEVEGLQISLNAAKTKLRALDRVTTTERPTLTNLGMPVIRQSC